MARKLVIDCDPGIDSALALSLALFSPEVEITAVTAVRRYHRSGAKHTQCTTGNRTSRHTRGLPTHRHWLIASCQLEHKPNPYLARIRDRLSLIRLIPHLDSDRHRLAITHHLNFNAFTERR